MTKNDTEKRLNAALRIFQNDPNIIKALQGFAISKANLRQYFRAPPGFVIRHDENGDPFGIPKVIAKKWLGYKEQPKPLFTGAEVRKVAQVNALVKRYKKFGNRLRRIANFGGTQKSPFEAAAQAAGKKAMAKALGKVAA